MNLPTQTAEAIDSAATVIQAPPPRPNVWPIPLLLALLMTQLVQVWQIQALPQAMLRAQAEALKAAHEDELRKSVAAMESSRAFEENQRQRRREEIEKQEFEQALARIPADIPEPQRSAAARELMRIEREEPMPGESDSAFQLRKAMREARLGL